MLNSITIEKLKALEAKFVDIEKQMEEPEVWKEQECRQRLSREHSEIKDIVGTFRQYCATERAFVEIEEVLENEIDPEIQEMCSHEMFETNELLHNLSKRLQDLLLTKDPNDTRNVILEIRSENNCDEAEIFTSRLFGMYQDYAEHLNWDVEILNPHSYWDRMNTREVFARIRGERVYAQLKWESGIHCIQYDLQEHTNISLVRVEVFPEADEVDINIEDKALEIYFYGPRCRSMKAVNDRYFCVRVMHLPTSYAVYCGDEKSHRRSQLKAMSVLRSRLYRMELEKQNKTYGIRVEADAGQIRTYDFSQNSITDHRFALTFNTPECLFDSHLLQKLIDSLHTAMQAEQLKTDV